MTVHFYTFLNFRWKEALGAEKGQPAAVAPEGKSHVLPLCRMACSVRSTIFEVLESLKDQTAPAPFAISKQYKKNRQMAAEDNGEEVEDEQEAEVPKAKSKEGKGKKIANSISGCGSVGSEKPMKSDEGEKPKWEFNKIKQAYIQAKTAPRLLMPSFGAEADGVSRAVATTAWNLSKEKAAILKNLTVAELVKRRFLAKGSKVNPWAA